MFVLVLFIDPLFYDILVMLLAIFQLLDDKSKTIANENTYFKRKAAITRRMEVFIFNSMS